MKIKALLKDYFQSKPELMTVCVNTGLKVAEVLTIPAKKILEGLLIVQDIDLNTEPGAARVAALTQALNEYHLESYDSDFDFSSVRMYKHPKNADAVKAAQVAEYVAQHVRPQSYYDDDKTPVFKRTSDEEELEKAREEQRKAKEKFLAMLWKNSEPDDLE